MDKMSYAEKVLRYRRNKKLDEKEYETPTSKKFGNKSYGLTDVKSTRKEAKEYQERLRGLGIMARIVKTPVNKFAVYSRSKT